MGQLGSGKKSDIVEIRPAGAVGQEIPGPGIHSQVLRPRCEFPRAQPETWPGPFPAPTPHPEQLESAGRAVHSSPVPGWAGRAAGPRPWPGQRAAGKPGTRPGNPDTRLSFRQTPVIRRAVALAGPESHGGRKECASLQKESGIGALASARPTAAARTRGQEPPRRSHLTPLNSTGAGETGARRGASRLRPGLAGNPGGGGASVSALLPGPRAAQPAWVAALIGPPVASPRPARRGLLPVSRLPLLHRPEPELPAGWVPAARAAPAGPPSEAEMTSKEDGKAAPGRSGGAAPLDHLPPPANSNKPLTPFSIEDILNKPSVRRSYSLCGAAHLLAAADKHAPGGLPLAGRALLSQTSPLCALEELASKTFKGLEVSVLQAAEGRDGMTIFGQRQTPKKRRKSRTAFTNHQIYELEKRFLYQKYLSPADRDQIAQQLGLTNAQVITWFQNRRAKLKRDLEEMKADVESAKKLGPSGQMDIVALAELEQNSEASGGGGGGCGRAKSRPGSPALPPGAPQAPGGGPLQLSPASPLTDQRASSQDCSEDEEDEEIDVDD